jgi:hypothetical protein
VQGASPPWRLYQNYIRDVALLRRGAIDDGVIEFSNGREPVTAAPVEEAEQVPA